RPACFRHRHRQGRTRRGTHRGGGAARPPVLPRRAVAPGAALPAAAAESAHSGLHSRGARSGSGPLMRGRPLVIGLAGGTGSGKTTITHALLETAAAGQAAVIPQDA